jgi:hypothetical protein
MFSTILAMVVRHPKIAPETFMNFYGSAIPKNCDKRAKELQMSFFNNHGGAAPPRLQHPVPPH